MTLKHYVCDYNEDTGTAGKGWEEGRKEGDVVGWNDYLLDAAFGSLSTLAIFDFRRRSLLHAAKSHRSDCVYVRMGVWVCVRAGMWHSCEHESRHVSNSTAAGFASRGKSAGTTAIRALFYTKCIAGKQLTLKTKVKVTEYNIHYGAIR